MKKILIIVSGYPSEKNLYNCSWAHTRNRHYIESGLLIDVYVPSVGSEYVIDGVKVISTDSFKDNIKNNIYNLVISHSPNIREHIPILKNLREMNKILFMHGTESMSVNHDYPKPYHYMKSGIIEYFIREIYDRLKFKVLKKFITSNKGHIHLVFVSDWMKNIFTKNVMSLSNENTNYSIIHNSLNNSFINRSYINENLNCPAADFITLRSLDLSKYAIDMIVSLACANPNFSFHIYGKGNYFKYNLKPDNVIVFERHIEQDKICDLLSKYKYALMPTRCDAQGVMACEIATYGMPMITTDIEINKDMFTSFSNVKLFSESFFKNKINIDDLPVPASSEKNKKFFPYNTLERELELIKSQV